MFYIPDNPDSTVTGENIIYIMFPNPLFSYKYKYMDKMKK